MNKKYRLNTILHLAAVAGVGFTLTSPSANAELIDILGGGGVTASSQIPETGTGDGEVRRNPRNLIDGSGLTGADHDQVTSNQWLSSSDGNPNWGGLDADPWVLFDLGAVYTVDSMKIWNFSEGAWSVGRGVNAVTVEYGDSTADLVSGVIDDSSTVPGITNLTTAPATSPTITGTTYSLGGIKARYIKIDITPGSGIGNHGGDNNFYGMNEVQFDGTLGSEPFAITEIDYAPDTGRLTLTWNSSPNETYGVYFSTDLIDWESDLDDSFPADADADETTATFDLNDNFPEGIPESAYFRVEKN